MRRLFSLYALLGPALATPLAIWVWARHYDGAAALVASSVTAAGRAGLAASLQTRYQRLRTSRAGRAVSSRRRCGCRTAGICQVLRGPTR